MVPKDHPQPADSAASAVLVMALAAIGLYSIVSYTTAARTKELGVRLALGASWSNVAIAVIGDAIMAVALGLAAGLPLALIVARAAERLLFGVSPADTTTYARTLEGSTLRAIRSRRTVD